MSSTWTPYQMRLIRALQSGEQLHFMTGLNAHYVIGCIKPSPSENTVRKLRDANMIALVKSDWRGETWRWAGSLEPPMAF